MSSTKRIYFLQKLAKRYLAFFRENQNTCTHMDSSGISTIGKCHDYPANFECKKCGALFIQYYPDDAIPFTGHKGGNK